MDPRRNGLVKLGTSKRSDIIFIQSMRNSSKCMSLKKEKHAEYMRLWRKKNPEKIKEIERKSRKKNSAKKSDCKRKWYLKNSDICKDRSKKNYDLKKDTIELKETRRNWRINNLEKVDQYSKKRDMLQKRATPKWANLKAIRQKYKEAKIISKLTGIKHSVDHIIPINNPFVSGLHVIENIQIIPLVENQKKSNRFEP